jgi:hypothetical protein
MRVVLVHVLNNFREIKLILGGCAYVLQPGDEPPFSCFGPAILEAGPWGAFFPEFIPAWARMKFNRWALTRHSKFNFGPKEIAQLVREEELTLSSGHEFFSRNASKILAIIHYGFSSKQLRPFGTAAPRAGEDIKFFHSVGVTDFHARAIFGTSPYHRNG